MGNIINRFLIILLFTTLMSNPVSAQSGWAEGQTYDFKTTWKMSASVYDQNGVEVGSEYFHEEQDFSVRIHDINESEETIELFTLFEDNFLMYPFRRESVFDSRIEWISRPNSYIGQEKYATSDFTYLNPYDYNQSYHWFIPVIYYAMESDSYLPFETYRYNGSEDHLYDIRFTGFYKYDYLSSIIPYLFIEPNFSMINDNLESIIMHLGVYDGTFVSSGRHRIVDNFNLKDLEDEVTLIYFMGEPNLEDGISKLSSTNQEWTLSIDMSNMEFLWYRYSESQGFTWHERVYEKYISSIELSYTDEGTLESLDTKIEKISIGDNDTVKSLIEKSIFQKGEVNKIGEFYNNNLQYIPHVNGLLIATIIILIVKKRTRGDDNK